MFIPTTPVHICNLALDRLGQREIASIDAPETQAEIICRRHYDTTRRELLRRYIFNFSKKYKVLTVSPTVIPAFGFSSAFTLPNDFVRLLALGDITLDNDIAASLYDLSEGYIYTDAGDGGELNIQYVKDATGVSKFDDLFVRLFTLHLASNMAYKFLQKPRMIAEIRQDATDVALAAAAISGQEKPPRRVERSRIRSVRRGGSSRDNSRIF